MDPRLDPIANLLNDKLDLPNNDKYKTPDNAADERFDLDPTEKYSSGLNSDSRPSSVPSEGALLSTAAAVSEDKNADMEGGNSTPEARDPVLPKWRLIALCFSCCSGLFLSLLDTSIVATAMTTIGTDFDSLNSITWIALAYTLSYLGCAVIFSRIADIIGRRNAFVAAFLIFFAFSLGCGFANSLNQLIACRALQGIGGSGLYSISMVIFPEISPPGMFKYIASLAGATVAMSGVLGPVLGGIITRYTTWRWIFWINAPIGVMPLTLFIIAWPGPNMIKHAERKTWKSLDIIGCVLLIAASVLIVFSFQEAGLTYGAWTTPLFLVPLIVGIFCCGLLAGWESIIHRIWGGVVAPIMPPRLLSRRVYSSATIATLLTGFPFFVIIYSLPIHFQVVNGSSPLSAGLGLLPMLGAVAVGSIMGGVLSGKKNRAFETLIVGSAFMIIGCAMLSTISNTGYVENKIYGAEVFAGLGFGFTVATVSLIANLESQIADSAVAQGIAAQARILGGSIGIAASTAMLGMKERTELAGVVSTAQLDSLQATAGQLTAEQFFDIKQAYTDAFTEAMIVCCAIGGACFLVTLGTFQKNATLNRVEVSASEEKPATT